MEPTPTEAEARPHVFNYQVLRGMIGFVAFLLPLLVWWFGCRDLPSVSASYHSGARNIFVACLSGVGGLMLAYQGEDASDWREFVLAKIGGIAAIFVAFAPTSCPGEGEFAYVCLENFQCSSAFPGLHVGAAIALFFVLGCLCLIFIQRVTEKRKMRQDKGEDILMVTLRLRLYWICLSVLVLGFLLTVAGFMKLLPWSNAVFAGEFAMLWAFGFVWLVASKILLPDSRRWPSLLWR